MQPTILAEEPAAVLPDFLATRLAYDERDALFYALLPLMLRRGKVALVPKLVEKMNRASGNKVVAFNALMERLIRVWSIKS